ncbi:MAG: malate transporter [Paracoccus denitrificans]|nr:MAG: malate transporter [Paracoccus denitrificans]PZO85456.1 MAG: malate transporter [Paracoccus denitrificans]
MLPIFLKTLPFFGLIGLGWLAGRVRFFPAEATAWLTRFVFYFALSAMLFRLAAGLDISRLFDPAFVAAYVIASGALWVACFALSRRRGQPVPDAAMQAQASMTGNTGFLGVPMLVMILGDAAIGPVMIVLTLDMIVFSTLITLVISATRRGKGGLGGVATTLGGIVANPMIVSMVAGLLWSAFRLPMPVPFHDFLTLLGSAATPGALFAIGASLAARSIGRVGPAIQISAAKLIVHPLLCFAACRAFGVAPGPAGVMIAAAALPVAGNVYILAHHFGVAQQRVSASILISTAVSIATVPIIIHYVAN